VLGFGAVEGQVLARARAPVDVATGLLVPVDRVHLEKPAAGGLPGAATRAHYGGVAATLQYDFKDRKRTNQDRGAAVRLHAKTPLPRTRQDKERMMRGVCDQEALAFSTAHGP
jgi:hypothetical protein